MTSTATVGHRIKALRAKRRLTVRQLATASGVAPSTITRIETGERQPLLVHLERLAVGLRCSARDLIPPRAA